MSKLWINGVEMGEAVVDLELTPTKGEGWPSVQAHFLTEATVSGSVTTEITADEYACWMEFAVTPTVYGEVMGGPFDGAQVPL